MQIQLRVRTNDVCVPRQQAQLVHNGFVLFDNCTEVKYGSRVGPISKQQFKFITRQAETLAENRTFGEIPMIHAETYTGFSKLIMMVRDVGMTESRITAGNEFYGRTRVEDRLLTEAEKETGKFYVSPYHYNVIEWRDRITDKRYRLIFDTILFILDDNGKTLRKIEG